LGEIQINYRNKTYSLEYLDELLDKQLLLENMTLKLAGPKITEEIERKFLCDAIEFEEASKYLNMNIEEYYTSFRPATRYRKIEYISKQKLSNSIKLIETENFKLKDGRLQITAYIKTKKGIGTLMHQEEELLVSKEEYKQEKYTHRIGKIIKKQRKVHIEDNYVVDIYSDMQLVILEKGFPTLEIAKAFKTIKHPYILKEVTEDLNYKNSSIALNVQI